MGVIAGVVRDEDGNAIEGARVYIVDGPGPVPDVALITGADGRFTLGAPVAGTYTIEASVEARAAARVAVDVSTQPVDLELRFSG